MAPILEPLGMTFDVKELERTTMYNKCDDAERPDGVLPRPRMGQGLRRTATRSAVRCSTPALSGRAAATTTCSARLPSR